MFCRSAGFRCSAHTRLQLQMSVYIIMSMCVDIVWEFGSAAQIQIILLSHCGETLAQTEVAAVALQYHRWSMERWIKARLTSGLLPHPVLLAGLECQVCH